MKPAILFGDNQQWAITQDDGCLQFHPQMNTDPKVISTHIWKEAWEQVEKFGGYDAAVKYLRGEEVVNAFGQDGFLIKTLEDNFVFRQYDMNYNFTDYLILHCDMHIKILESTAVMDRINKTIDYEED